MKNLEPKIRTCVFIFVDLEKAFDLVSREVICSVFRRKSVLEYLVNGVMSLYKGCKTAVSVDRELSSLFFVKCDVHQSSALSPLLFITAVHVLTEGVGMVH